MKLYTVASDSRIADLAVLLESVARVTSLPLHVIPFDDNLELTSELCAIYGAVLCGINPLWDELGRHVFGKAAHLERGSDVKAWRYFRKFNSLTLAEGEALMFLDANSALLVDPAEVLSSCGNEKVVFGHFSKPGRNISRFGMYLINSLESGRLRNHGYGAGFWLVPAGRLNPSMFEDLLLHQEIASLIGPAPEQGILNLVIALQGISTALLRESTDHLEYWMIPLKSDCLEHVIEFSEGWVLSRNGKQSERYLAVAKWTGDYHRGAFEFPQRALHRIFVDAALSKVAGSNRLVNQLGRLYLETYGHEFD
tara:strand:- start:176 stop:1105 length:930 start_codon:yes stop_codon:yes gene_type:complete